MGACFAKLVAALVGGTGVIWCIKNEMFVFFLGALGA
jgi:hypothetical protein